MDEWKEQIKEYAAYCKEDRKELWIKDIDELDISKFQNVPQAYEDHKKSFIKTAEIMKALDEGESWDQISERLMEGHKYCQYSIGEIVHNMLCYSKHGTEFAEKVGGESLFFIFPILREEYQREVELKNKTLNQ